MQNAQRGTNGARCEDYGLTLHSGETVSPAVVIAPEYGTESHLQELASTIETSIIPRLLLGQMGQKRLSGREPFQLPDPPVSAAMVESFVRLVMSQDNIEATEFVDELLARGVPMPTVLLGLMAPAARLLGDMWSADLCDFVDVTLGLSRMQQILRRFSMAGVNGSGAVAKGRQALLLPAPGEQHTFGLRVVEEFLLRDGWTVRSNLRATEHDVVSLVAEEDYDFVGFTLSGETLIDALASAIGKVRETSGSNRLRVLVGGVIFSEHPELVRQVGADGYAHDAVEAVALANQWARASAFA
jgi:methanogenic corrinoid protein MtbC1